MLVNPQVEIPDDTVRSYVAMSFASVNRWGVWGHRRDLWDDFPGGERELDRRMQEHGSMFVARSLALLSDVINNRLYERVREKGGLVYSIDLMFDPMFYADAGFFTGLPLPLPLPPPPPLPLSRSLTLTPPHFPHLATLTPPLLCHDRVD